MTGARGKSREQRREIKTGNIKQLVRRFKTAIPLTYYLSIQDDVREYLLFCAIHAQAKLNHKLIVPEYLNVKQVTAKEYEDYGQSLARKSPMNPYGAYVGTPA